MDSRSTFTGPSGCVPALWTLAKAVGTPGYPPLSHTPAVLSRPPTGVLGRALAEVLDSVEGAGASRCAGREPCWAKGVTALGLRLGKRAADRKSIVSNDPNHPHSFLPRLHNRNPS